MYVMSLELLFIGELENWVHSVVIKCLVFNCIILFLNYHCTALMALLILLYIALHCMMIIKRFQLNSRLSLGMKAYKHIFPNVKVFLQTVRVGI